MAKVTNRDGSRWYTWPEPDGSGSGRYMSVTTIIDLGIPKPALIGWAAKETAIAAVEKIKSVFAILNDVPEGLTGAELKAARESQRETAIDLLKGARFKKNKEAKLTGSKIHEGIEAYKLGRPFPGVPATLADYWGAFERMLVQQEPVFLQTEANVYNRTRRYAGTLDTIGVWPHLEETFTERGLNIEDYYPKPWKDERGPVLVNDYKTGKGPKKGGVWPETALQLSGYRNGEFIAGPEGKEWPMPETDGALAIHLQPGWYELVPVDTGPAVFAHFLHAYETAIWQENTSKGVIGPALTERFPDSKIEEAKPEAEPQEVAS